MSAFRGEGKPHRAAAQWSRPTGSARRRSSGSGPRHGLKPHRVKTFKLSNDRHFQEKLVDVAGLYLNPPEQAVGLCVDEKSRIQELDRTQASLRLKKGRAGDDPRLPRTTTLFAALDVLSARSEKCGAHVTEGRIQSASGSRPAIR